MKRKLPAKPETVRCGNVAVKVYQRKRATERGGSRVIYEIADYTSGARRLRGFGDHGQARHEALRIAQQLATGETTAARMLNNEAASYGRAIELLRPTGATLELAAASYAKAFQILGDHAVVVEAATFYARHRADQVERRKVDDVVGELLATKEARGKSARYLGDLRSRLGRFAESFAVDISSVTTPDVQRWLDGLKVAPQTLKNFRTVLHGLFSFAESRGYVFKGGNPVALTEKITANGGDVQIFTPEEIAKLLAAAPKDFLPFVAIGAFSGLRSAEIERLEWADVDLAGGFIHVSAARAKTRSRRLVPVQPNLAQWLAPYAKRSGKVWNGSADDLRDARAACVKAAGLAWKNNGLRHSFASYRLAQIQSAAQVALECGNSPAMVFQHYRELVKHSTSETWFSIAPEAATNVVRMPKSGTA